MAPKSAISLTFDVDCESGWLGEDDAYVNRLSTLSEARFGATRGVPRILEILERHEIQGTFYIPGDTAERHAETCRAIVAAGHEVGHHGYLHLRSDGARRKRSSARRSSAAWRRSATLGVTPRGYRSPSWELTPETFALLQEHDFAWDSSLMGDDRPYLHDGHARAARALEPRRLAAPALEARPRRRVHRARGLPRHLAGRVRVGAARTTAT